MSKIKRSLDGMIKITYDKYKDIPEGSKVWVHNGENPIKLGKCHFFSYDPLGAEYLVEFSDGSRAWIDMDGAANLYTKNGSKLSKVLKIDYKEEDTIEQLLARMSEKATSLLGARLTIPENCCSVLNPNSPDWRQSQNLAIFTPLSNFYSRKQLTVNKISILHMLDDGLKHHKDNLKTYKIILAFEVKPGVELLSLKITPEGEKILDELIASIITYL